MWIKEARGQNKSVPLNIFFNSVFLKGLADGLYQSKANGGQMKGAGGQASPVSATVQLLLTSCARHPNHYLQDNAKSN